MGSRRDNIPIEALRTFMAVTEAGGNHSKAGQALGLTQPGVTSQIKRLERIIGKPLLERTRTGMKLTEAGNNILLQGRRIVSINDQMISYARPARLPDQIRIGMPRWITRRMFIQIVNRCRAAHKSGKITLHCDNLGTLTNDIGNGVLDIVVLCDQMNPPGTVFEEWSEPLHWVKSSKLTLHPGMPIPLISWPGSSSDRHATRSLAEAGIQYEVTVTAPDLATRVAAVVAGMGLMILSTARMQKEVRIADEPFLPRLPSVRKGVYIRDSLDVGSAKAVAQALVDCIKMAPPLTDAATRGQARPVKSLKEVRSIRTSSIQANGKAAV
jgi:DNA-binding transcriptional LysR family regulator